MSEKISLDSSEKIYIFVLKQVFYNILFTKLLCGE